MDESFAGQLPALAKVLVEQHAGGEQFTIDLYDPDATAELVSHLRELGCTAVFDQFCWTITPPSRAP